jgi:tetraacyldisaccharide 4'-kinase
MIVGPRPTTTQQQVNKMKLEQYLLRKWYQKNSKLAKALLPISMIYALVVRLRRVFLTRFACWYAPIPVVVVGNITLGGVGKTPLVAAIAKHYTQLGWKVGIVSRGYGAKRCHFPHEVTLSDTSDQVGDEPLLLAQMTACPVVIAPKRVHAVQTLLNKYSLDLIISDDGLQHYALGRQVEIAVVDVQRKFGNGCLLPAGPLREPVSRLNEVHLIVMNDKDSNTISTKQGFTTEAFHKKSIEKPKIKYSMQLQPLEFKALKTGIGLSLDAFKDKHVSAVAAIGHPERFFNLLKQLGVLIEPHVFSDHHVFNEKELDKMDCIVMTEKDAVKCVSFAKDNWFSLSVEPQLEADFWVTLSALLEKEQMKEGKIS